MFLQKRHARPACSNSSRLFPPLRQAAATPQPYKMRASCKVGLWKERPPHAKTLRLCVEVCCSLVAEILNLSSSLWITLNSFELSLLFFGDFLLFFSMCLTVQEYNSYNWRLWVWSDLDRIVFHSSRHLSILPELLILRFHWILQNSQGSFDAWEQGNIKLAEEILLLPPVSPCAVARASGRENLFGRVAICLSVYTQNSKWVNAAGIPSATLTLICLAVPWHSEGQGQCHAVMAPYITPPPTRTQASIQWQPERTSVSRAAITFEWLSRRSWKMQCNTEKSRQMRYKPKSITSRRLNFLMLDSAFSLFFLLSSFLFNSPFPPF